MDNYGSKHKIPAICFVICLLILMTIPVRADGENCAKQPCNKKLRQMGPYCGIFCLYSSMKLLEKEIDINDLIKPEYFSSSRGSSLKNLQLAALNQGLYAVPLEKLGTGELHSISYPMILHVKSTTDAKEYDHYELFLGSKNGKAVIFDPPEPVKTIPFYQLAPVWDGTGLIISDEQIDLSAIFNPSQNRLTLYIIAGLGVMLLLHFLNRRLSSYFRPSGIRLLTFSTAQVTIMIIGALLFGLIYHFASDEGFIAHADSILGVQQAHIGNFIPKVSKNKISKLLDSDTVFIDARLARDFNEGHFEGAISVPVNSTDEQRHQALANIDKNARLVVYCQSAGCKFAEKVSAKLIDDGFTNVSIFKGGWNEWKENNNK